jgi:hypothetical protein
MIIDGPMDDTIIKVNKGFGSFIGPMPKIVSLDCPTKGLYVFEDTYSPFIFFLRKYPQFG